MAEIAINAIISVADLERKDVIFDLIKVLFFSIIFLFKVKIRRIILFLTLIII